MKNTSYFLSLSIVLLLISSCDKNEIVSANEYECNLAFSDSSFAHPKAAIYQSILDQNRKKGIVGASLMIKDRNGVWLGSSGQADLASNVSVQSCNRFLIASISKVFTASAIFRYIDQGILSLDDPITKWLDESMTDKIANAKDATIRHLLNHTSGIADYYTLQFELDRANIVFNNFTQENVLSYAYGKKATHDLGETYYYSNTNFLLLGIILENASGISLDLVYQDEVFDPLNLNSAYFGKDIRIPNDVVKGYIDIYGNGQYVEGEFLYKDELNTADGGIAINAYDLGVFIERLAKGDLISSQSLAQMTEWFDLPPDWIDEDFGHFQNGLGLEYKKTDYGNALGHTGSIDGYLSIVQYFPDDDATFVLLINSASHESEPRLKIYNQCLAQMFN